MEGKIMKTQNMLLNALVIAAMLLSNMVAVPATSASTTSIETQAQGGNMPGWTLPTKPIPHHEPGQPARSGKATTQVNRLNAYGEAETVQLTGLDAMVADGTLSDPLQGNYTIVKHNSILFSYQGLYINPWPQAALLADSYTYQGAAGPERLCKKKLGDPLVSASAAGDLNGDLIDEEIVAWLDPSTKHFMVSIGELQCDGQYGKTTSAPAVVHATGGPMVVARGYDNALWQLDTIGRLWSNDAGGMLLSGPAAASRANGQMDAFGVGLDNQLYHTLWNGSSWSSWQQVEGSGIFPVIPASLPLQDVLPPAVAARSASQLDVFRIAPDHTLYWISSADGGTSWGTWESLGGMLASAPAAVSLESNRMLSAVLGMDGALWYRLYNGSSWESWGRLEVPAGVTSSTQPALASVNPGQVAVFLPGADNTIWSSTFDGSTWGAWSDLPQIPDGALIAGIGAGGGGGTLSVYAQMTDGSLRQWDGASWQGKIYLPTAVTADTGLSTSMEAALVNGENGIFDITTGYFSGDGRQQIALAYLESAPPASQIGLAIFDIRDGFNLEKVAQLDAPIDPGIFPRIAAGDANGDSLEEIGLVYIQDNLNVKLRVYQVVKNTDGTWEGSLAQLSETLTIDHFYPFGGTLQIAAGDVIPEAPGVVPNDEFAFLADWSSKNCNPAGGCNNLLSIGLFLYDLDAAPDEYIHLLNNWEAGYTVEDDLYLTGASLAIGDLNGPQTGYGLEEVVVTRPDAFMWFLWPGVERDLFLFSYEVSTKNLKQVGFRDLPGYSTRTQLDTLAIGDLDMDMQNELVFAGHTNNDDINSGYYLYTYEATVNADGSITLPDPSYQAVPAFVNYDLALGDFTGESLRVGSPTYRIQNKMTTPVVLLNMPPLHRDIIKVDGVDTVIEAVSGAYAEYTTDNTTTTKYSTESRREWSLSTGFEMGAGGGGHKITASFDDTYGENFSNVTQEIQAVNITATDKADMWDKVIHNETDYAIWEYPVYGLVDGDASVPRTITVIWPLVDLPGETNIPDSTTSNLCDENFYTPGHHLYNAWSYDDIGVVRFSDLESTIFSQKIDGGGNTITWTMLAQSIDSRTSSFKNQISAGLEYSYQNELKIPLVGKAFDFSFRAYAKGSFTKESISTFVSELSDQLKVVMDYPSATDPTIKLPAIQAYLYWAKADYLVLDYQTRPDAASTFWSVYDKPDPAFILPWYGLPDLNGTQHELCTTKQFFTHNIEVSPSYAESGETVTLTATVRNFSDETIENSFIVKFYRDDPALGNEIGQCQIGPFSRANGAQQCSTTWEVNGVSGEGRIYAVIDAGNAIDEMHEQSDLINNNKGYGLLMVANGDTFDPGLRMFQAYQPVPYQEAPGLSFDLYLPTNNLTKVENPGQGLLSYSYVPNTVLFETIPTPISNLQSVGTPIKIQAFLNDTVQTSYTFQPAPASIMLQYRDSDLLSGMNEANLKLYRLGGNRWVEATCPGYEIVRFPSENRLAAPICQTGTFALSDSRITGLPVYLPVLRK